MPTSAVDASGDARCEFAPGSPPNAPEEFGVFADSKIPSAIKVPLPGVNYSELRSRQLSATSAAKSAFIMGPFVPDVDEATHRVDSTEFGFAIKRRRGDRGAISA